MIKLETRDVMRASYLERKKKQLNYGHRCNNKTFDLSQTPKLKYPTGWKHTQNLI